MSHPLLSVLTLHDLALAHARYLEPRVLVFGETPPDASSRRVPYLVIDPDPGYDRVTRADGRVSSRQGRFSVRCCGSTPQQASLALDACRGRFVDWRPFPSLRWGAALESDAGPLIKDTSIPTEPRFSFTLTYDIDD
ncbi:hypothetical protein ACTQ40_08940 [Collinsella sp. Sow4_D11]|uniref:hypothetical protein n=1 Tax=Coriobacteriales TaxID=84999 RepID=UPI003F8E1AA5